MSVLLDDPIVPSVQREQRVSNEADPVERVIRAISRFSGYALLIAATGGLAYLLIG